MYLLLSRDDGDEGESNSIGNQRKLIKGYADKLVLKLSKNILMMDLQVQTLKDQILKDAMTLKES